MSEPEGNEPKEPQDRVEELLRAAFEAIAVTATKLGLGGESGGFVVAIRVDSQLGLLHNGSDFFRSEVAKRLVESLSTEYEEAPLEDQN